MSISNVFLFDKKKEECAEEAAKLGEAARCKEEQEERGEAEEEAEPRAGVR